MAKQRTQAQQAKHDKKASRNRIQQECLKRTSKAALVKVKRKARRIAERQRREKEEAELRAQGKPVAHLFANAPVEPIITLFLENRRVKVSEQTVTVKKDGEPDWIETHKKVFVRDFRTKRIKLLGKWTELQELTKWRPFPGAVPATEQPTTGAYTGITARLTNWLRMGLIDGYLPKDHHKDLRQGTHMKRAA
jgi:hypothetical protein